MTKLKKILSPDDIRLGERIERQKATVTEQIRQKMRREQSLLSPDGDVDVTNAQAQMGRVLHRHELMRRLTRLNPGLSSEVSIAYPDHAGIYMTEHRMNPETGHYPWKRFICGIPSDQIGEFDVREVKREVIPDPTIALHWQTIQAVDGRIPGWRTVLLRLLQEGILSPAGIDREFQITKGRSSQKWQEAVN